MQEFTVEEVAKHNTKESLWIVIKNRVYDVTEFIKEHPGGDLVIIDRAGDDATIEFEGQEHSADAKVGRSFFKTRNKNCSTFRRFSVTN